jgi:Cys-tRNA(Pro) deacylase
VAHEVLSYRYTDRGGAPAAAEALGLELRAVVKTLILEDADRQPLIVLMHGDREVSLKALARQLGTRSVRPCSPAVAERHSGYRVGGTSPLGTRRAMPICAERSITDLDAIAINAGARGWLVQLSPADLLEVLGEVTLVDAGG